MSSNRPPFKRGDPRARSAGRKGGKVSAAQRASKRLSEVQNLLDRLAPLTVLDWMDRLGQVGDSWKVQRMVAKISAHIALTAEEFALYQETSGGRTTIPTMLRVLWELFGRRSGKSQTGGTFAVNAATKRYPQLKAGEKGYVLLVAQDRSAADVVFSYVAGAFETAEVDGTEGFAIIEAAGLKPFPPLTERQQAMVESRQRQVVHTRREFARFPRFPSQGNSPIGGV